MKDNKALAREIFKKVMKPNFMEAIRDGELIQVIFSYDMTTVVWCTDYALKLKIQKELEAYEIKYREVGYELVRLFAEDKDLDDVIIIHNPGKDTGDLMVNREEFFMFIHLEN